MQNYFYPADFGATLPVIAGATKTNSPFYEKGFNLALHCNDDRAKVLENRLKLAQSLNLTNKNWLWLNQIHSEIVITDEDYYEGISADAVISRNKNNIPVVMTADCVPILLTSPNGEERAAIHAGWQGLFKGIIKNTLEKMLNPKEQIYAWIAPCAGKDNYEVDLSFYQRFWDLDKNYQQFFKPNRPNHHLADLSGIAEYQLRQGGVKNITNSRICSITKPNFFSYRRDKEKAGRMATFIA